MTKTKSNRIFLGIVTGFMALAGTGLTLANNWAPDVQIAAIALTLAACFSAAETCFLWGHKRSETATRLWRKIAINVSLAVLVVSMGWAVWEELKFALHKLSNRSLAGNSAMIISSADVKNQKSIARSALKTISDDKVKTNPDPFVACYVITGLVSILILACTEKQRERKIKGPAVLTSEMGEQIRGKLKLDPAGVKIYAAKGGHAIYAEGKYQGFISGKKDKIGFVPEQEKQET